MNRRAAERVNLDGDAVFRGSPGRERSGFRRPCISPASTSNYERLLSMTRRLHRVEPSPLLRADALRYYVIGNVVLLKKSEFSALRGFPIALSGFTIHESSF